MKEEKDITKKEAKPEKRMTPEEKSRTAKDRIEKVRERISGSIRLPVRRNHRCYQ